MKFEIEMSKQADAEVQKSILEQVYYLSPRIEKCGFKNNILIVEVTGDDGGFPGLKKNIEEICSKTEESFRKVVNRSVFSHDGLVTSNGGDPNKLLEKIGDLIPHSDGRYVFQGKLLRLIRSLDSFWRKYALSIGAREQDYPSTLPIESLVDCGYLAGFPQHAGFISFSKKSLESFSHLSSVKNSSALGSLNGVVDEPKSLLAPTVCYHCFQSLKNSPLQKTTVLTAISKCHRNEDKMVVGLERLNTFTMREIIFLGSQSDVLEIKNKIFQKTTEVIKRWNLKSQVVSANDPFFTSVAANKRAYQSVMDLKQEVQVYLPYNKKWLACASLNNHLSTLTKSFGIYNDSIDGNLHSGCVGFGFERLALGILAQFGYDEAKWPKDLRDDLLFYGEQNE